MSTALVLRRLVPHRARSWIALGGAVVLLALLLAPHGSPQSVDLDNTFASPSWAHPLGTDNLGRDLASRTAAGLERTLTVVLIAAGLSLGAGVALGVVAGYVGGAARVVVRGIADLVLIVPTFVAALIVAAFLGLTPVTAGIALGLFGIGPFIHQSESLVRAVRERPYLEVERLMGTPVRLVLSRHVLPAITRPVLTYLGSVAAGYVMAYAGLAFVGLGVDATTPDWGTMLYEYRVHLVTHPLLVIAPTLGIAILALTLHCLLDRGDDPVEGVVP